MYINFVFNIQEHRQEEIKKKGQKKEDFMERIEKNVKKTMPMFILVFISSAIMISVFNIISPQLIVDFKIDSSTVSLLSMIGMLMMGIASVVYSTLSDSVSIRKLMIFGISLLNIGALLSLLFSNMNFYLLLVSSAFMVFGGTCGSGLMIITVTRYLNEKEHAKYFGYNTACVQVSQALGVLIGGVVTTYLEWNYLYAIPLLSLIALPTIWKYLPDEKGVGNGKLDIIGLGIFTLFTLFISLYFNISQISYLLAAAFCLVCFLIYITKAKHAFIQIDFFLNRHFMLIIILAFITFGLQTAFSFLFPFMAQGVYGITLDKVSFILLPSYVAAAFVGVNGGRIVNKFGSYKALLIGIFCAVVSSVFTACMADKGIILLGLGALLYAASFGFLYPPFLKLVIKTLDLDKLGAGIGFFNLVTGIGPSLMIVLTGKMMSMPQFAKGFGIVKTEASLFSNILFIYAILLLFIAVVLLLKKKIYMKGE